jgi:probable rRNA maturation factor
MIVVKISRSLPVEFDPVLVERAAREALRIAPGEQEVGLTILLTGDRTIRRINRQYRGDDHATDVLAFPADYSDPDTGEHYLGDILISYPRAQAQAASGGHPAEEEVQLLVVHGVLHLIGFDHDAPEAAARMGALQADILKRLGCRLSPPVL